MNTISKDLAKALIPMVNNLEFMELLTEYIDSRKEYIKEQIVYLPNLTDVAALQGAYAELDKLGSIKDSVDISKGK